MGPLGLLYALKVTEALDIEVVCVDFSEHILPLCLLSFEFDMIPCLQQYSYLAFFAHEVSKESENGRFGGRKAVPLRRTSSFAQIKPAKINLSLFGRFRLHFSVRQRIMPDTRQYAHCSL